LQYHYMIADNCYRMILLFCVCTVGGVLQLRALDDGPDFALDLFVLKLLIELYRTT
jgi:hypothetical protein